MVELERGLFLVEEKMPCEPEAIRIGHYFLPATLGRVEREEAAARIIYFSHQYGRWVGVSWPRLKTMLIEDYERQIELEKACRRYLEERHAWLKKSYAHLFLSVLTLGVWALLVVKSKPPVHEEVETPPLTGIYAFGAPHVITGITELLDRGMLKKATLGEGEEVVDILFPTPALVMRIMEVQRVLA